MEIVVIGGGVGGLTAALALAQGGHRVQVLERASRFAQAGPGLRLAPNATAVLALLGLVDQVLELGARPRRAVAVRADDPDWLCPPAREGGGACQGRSKSAPLSPVEK